MTQLIIVILGILSTTIPLYVIAFMLNYSLKKLLKEMFLQDDALMMFNMLLTITFTFTFITVYFAINNTFLHFKY